MGLYVLFLILIERYCRKKRSTYLIIGFAALVLWVLGHLFVILSGRAVVYGRLTYADYYLRNTLVSYLLGQGTFAPLAVYCLYRAFREPKKHPLVPTLVISVASSLVINIAGSILIAKVVPIFNYGLYGELVVNRYCQMAMNALIALITGICAASWIQYVDFAKHDEAGGEKTPEQKIKSDLSYLEEYKKKLKEGNKNV